MKKLIVFLLLLIPGWMIFAQSTKEEKIPITTTSEKAKSLYIQALDASKDVYLKKYWDLTSKALKEDPDFFMVNFHAAIFNLYFNNIKNFNENATKAINCKAKLSKGELLLKDAAKKLLENKNADVTEFGKKLIEAYPKDENSYYYQIFFQGLIKDYKGGVPNLKKAIEIAEKPAPYYNYLGYTYMNLEQYPDAEIAFDKYIELAPENPNSYDSKGDYYMKVKNFNKAYDNYMKAYKIDTAWSYKKAINAKAIADSISKK